MTTIIDFTARIRAALNGEASAESITTREDVCHQTGQVIVYYSVVFNAQNFCMGSMSKVGFDRWLDTGMSRDVERIAAFARVGLDYDGAGGECYLMDGWTWDQHDKAVAAVNA